MNYLFHQQTPCSVSTSYNIFCVFITEKKAEYCRIIEKRAWRSEPLLPLLNSHPIRTSVRKTCSYHIDPAIWSWVFLLFCYITGQRLVLC